MWWVPSQTVLLGEVIPLAMNLDGLQTRYNVSKLEVTDQNLKLRESDFLVVEYCIIGVWISSTPWMTEFMKLKNGLREGLELGVLIASANII